MGNGNRSQAIVLYIYSSYKRGRSFPVDLFSVDQSELGFNLLGNSQMTFLFVHVNISKWLLFTGYFDISV